jgi:hypothetical protein
MRGCNLNKADIIIVADILVVITAVFSALSWFISSMIKIPTEIKSGFGKLVGVEEMTLAFRKQSRFNSSAAFFAAISSAFQLLSQFLK